jgi:hypothetical protein
MIANAPMLRAAMTLQPNLGPTVFLCLFAITTGHLHAADPVVFPKPNPEKFLAEMKVFDAKGSPLRIPIEDWDGARARVKSDPAWSRWLAGERKEVDAWIANRADRKEWVAGWYHDFVSPKDGSRLQWTPEVPTARSLRSGSDPSVELTPKLFASWVFSFRQNHAEIMRRAASLFRLTGDTKYADWAAGQLDFYAENFASWPQPENPRSGRHLMWQSLDEATLLVKNVQTVRLLGEHATPARRAMWFEKMFKPQCDLLDGTLKTIHNIACWHRSAVGQVALVYRDDAMWKKAIDGPFGVREQIARGVTSDYFWYEQSMGYNSYMASALQPLFETACLMGRGKELAAEMMAVENLVLAPVTLRFADGHLPTPADSGRSSAPNRSLLASTARMFPTPIGLDSAGTRKGWDALLDPQAPVKGRSTAPPKVVSHNLESTRMAVLVEGPWQVFFHYGQLTASHAQAEALNYEATFDGVDVTHDTGTVGYGSPLHRDYYTQGLAHNVPLINSEGQRGWSPGELIGFDAKGSRVAASQVKYRPNAMARRMLSIKGDALVDEVEVRAGSTPDGKGEAAIGLPLHLQGKVALTDAFQPDPDFARGRPAGFARWTDVRTATFQKSASLDAEIGGKAFRIAWKAPGTFRLSVASSPDAPPKRRQTVYLEVPGATRAVIETTIAPRP